MNTEQYKIISPDSPQILYLLKVLINKETTANQVLVQILLKALYFVVTVITSLQATVNILVQILPQSPILLKQRTIN
jgi:hypothetical protein